MSEESCNKGTGDHLDDSINGEFANQEGDEAEGALGSSAGSDSDILHKKRRTQTPSPRPTPASFMVQPSPPKFVTFDDLMAAANGVKNMSLAHEIAVNSEFKIEKLEPPPKSIEKQVKEVMHKAFWDMFTEKMSEDPPDYGHAIVLIQETKEKLLSLLLPQHVRLRDQLNEVLDSDLIQQKLENDAFDIHYYSDYVINIMSKLCAPARDERIAKIREIQEVVPLFKEIFEVLDLMSMDMANFTIQQIRPYIQQTSVEYERKKFAEFLKSQTDAGVDGLECTKQWLSRSFKRLCQTLDPAGVSQSPLATPAAILNEAYMEILQWNDAVIFPETLVMDHARFLDLRDQTWQLTLVTSVLLVTYNTVGSPIAGVQPLKEQMKGEICTLLEGVENKDLKSAMLNVAEQINKTVNAFMTEHGFPVRDEVQQKTLIGQIQVLTSRDTPVILLMSKRLMLFIQQALFSKHTEPLKVPAGMSVMEKELSQICGRFLRLISHNRSVFGNYYTDIIGAMLKRQQEDLSPRPST